MKLEYKPYTLKFKFQAGTSRGVMTEHKVVYIKLTGKDNPLVSGIGEVAPLPGLSEDNLEENVELLEKIKGVLEKKTVPITKSEAFRLVHDMIPLGNSSLRFGLEVALLDLINGGKKIIFDSPFVRGEQTIPINGLIWMNDLSHMLQQTKEKLDKGFVCIKMKVGAINFEDELKVIAHIRKLAPDVMIRLDANGAFKNNEALAKLNRLSDFDIHSIEQPILPRQHEAMQLICKRSPIPIALDEELIGVNDTSQRVELLRFLNPAYIILKPSLHGGISSCEEWIKIAREMGVGYWMTSALESNIGLNAICQFTDYYELSGYHGLGTGQLYTNNIPSPLRVISGKIGSLPEINWGAFF